MKSFILGVLFLGHLANAQVVYCSNRGFEDEIKRRLVFQITEKIKALKSSGIDVAEESIAVYLDTQEPYSELNLIYEVSGGFSSTKGTDFTITGPKNSIGNPSTLRVSTIVEAKNFDREGNPLDGKCIVAGGQSVNIENKKYRTPVGNIIIDGFELYKIEN